MLQLKNIISVSFVFLFALFAQDAFAQRGQHGDIVEHLKNHLELTAEQETELNAIAEKYNTRIKELRTDANGSGENREKIKELRHAQRAEVNKVLTAEQEAILKEKRMANRANHQKGEHQAMRAEMKKYREENVKPVFAAQLVQLESKISAADRATLAELRVIFAKEKQPHTANGKKGERPNREERATQRDAFETKYAKEIATLKSLTEKYDAELENIRVALQPQAEQWKKDMQAISQKHLTDAEGKKGHGGKKGHHEKSTALQGKKAKSHFLLMDPAA